MPHNKAFCSLILQPWKSYLPPTFEKKWCINKQALVCNLFWSPSFFCLKWTRNFPSYFKPSDIIHFHFSGRWHLVFIHLKFHFKMQASISFMSFLSWNTWNEMKLYQLSLLIAISEMREHVHQYFILKHRQKNQCVFFSTIKCLSADAGVE